MRGASSLTADEIVQKSVQANEVNWKAAPSYSFVENDAITKGGKTLRKKYEVLMIEGSDYHKLLALNGQPLSAAQMRSEETKLQREIARRRQESPGARRQRIAQFTNERRQDHELMAQMIRAFQYRLMGNETMNGRACYVLEATPRPGYVPPNRDAKVLTGMRGKLWVDVEQFQWVKVHAEVFRPVAFGLFIAHVQPGTEFTLEEAPVAAGIWLPSRFATDVKANVMGLWSRNSRDEESYSGYHLAPK